MLGIDIGGTGSRWIASSGLSGVGPGVSVGSRGIDGIALLREICSEIRHAVPDRAPEAVAVGMTGLVGLVPDPRALLSWLANEWQDSRILLASDAVTALAGALGLEGGACVAAGTGVIGFGGDFAEVWRSVDGWGHVLGDEGGGAWIGAAGLRAALHHCDGRAGASATLAALAIAQFGALDTLPRQIYTRDDRASVLASFAPAVVTSAADGDPVSANILREAGAHLAATAIAAVGIDLPRRVSLVGGVADASPLVVESFTDGISAVGIAYIPAAGSPLDGALYMATALAADPSTFHHHPPFLLKEER